MVIFIGGIVMFIMGGGMVTFSGGNVEVVAFMLGGWFVKLLL